MTPKQKKYLSVALWVQGILAVMVPLVWLLSRLTRDWGYLRVGECIFRNLLHIYCLGCGVTRAVEALFDLDLALAFTLSPAFFLAVAVALWMDAVILLSIARRRESWLRLASPYLLWGLLAASVLIAVVRTVLAYTTGYDVLGDLSI